MKSKYIITGLLLFPFFLFGSITEQEIVDILGTDYHSEAAQTFIKKMDPTAAFPAHTEFSYNFYEQGISLRITAGKWIQGVRIYNKTMLFKAAAGSLPYGIDFSKGTSFASAAQGIGRKPLIKDNTRGQLYIFPNQLPDVDYLIELSSGGGKGVMSIAWMIPENKMEEIVVSNTPALAGLENHSVIMDLFTSKKGTAAFKKVIDHPGLKVEKEKNSYDYVRYSIGMFAETSSAKTEAGEDTRIVDDLTFFRRKKSSSQFSFGAALPEGLYWWSSPEDCIAQGFTVLRSNPNVGDYKFEKKIEKGKLTLYFNKTLMDIVNYKMDK